MSDRELTLEYHPTTVEKIRGLPWSIAFSAINMFMVQFTFFGSAFVLFLSDLGLNKTQIGFLLSLLPFLGLIALLIPRQVARFGTKRTFLSFFGVRTVFAACLLLVPWVLTRFGSAAVLAYVAGVTVFFSLSRSIAMTGWLPWQQEFVPSEMRGKYSAMSNIFINLSGLVAVSVAGVIIGDQPVLGRYLLLFGLGSLFGVVSVYVASFIPGGAPAPRGKFQHRQIGLRAPLRDRTFWRFLLGIGFFTLATTPMFSFLPLYMQERVGLSSGNVVLLQNGVLLGGLLSSYFWGWMADRYGSLPVTLSGVFLTVLLPILWMLMPKEAATSLYVALAIALLQGMAGMGWGIGSGRLLYVNLVPEQMSSSYMALYNAWTGVIGGISQLVGGRALDVFSGFHSQLFGLQLDSYGILFGLGLLLTLISSLVLRPVRPEREVSLGEFAGLFLHGNPLMAVDSLIRFHFAKDEPATISVTERLGQARSPLTVEELLQALEDPRFYVRFEAIVSIARRGPDERLIHALAEILQGNDPALSVIAAWALGRMGDRRALDPLRSGLDAPYRSVIAHAARSLGSLDDVESIPLLMTRLENEKDPGLQVAYASALGRLQANEAVLPILSLLYIAHNQDSRQELALSLARLASDENQFVHLLRSASSDAGTVLSQAVTAAAKKLRGFPSAVEDADPGALADKSAELLAQGAMDAGVQALVELIQALRLDQICDPGNAILQECARRMAEFGMQRMEYIILAVCTLSAVQVNPQEFTN